MKRGSSQWSQIPEGVGGLGTQRTGRGCSCREEELVYCDHRKGGWGARLAGPVVGT